MELCRQCPMRDERYESADQESKRLIAELRTALDRRGYFIEYLFEHSEHCDHILYSEAWEEFEQWENSRSNNESNNQRSVATEADNSNVDDKQTKNTET